MIIVDSTAFHARELAKNLRPEDELEAINQGLTPTKALFNSFRRAFYRKTALIDGKVAAMWGVAGAPMGIHGQLYFVTSPLAETILVSKFVRLYKQEIQEMLKLFPVLEGIVDHEYYSAIRLLKLAGASVSKPFEINRHLFRSYKFV